MKTPLRHLLPLTLLPLLACTQQDLPGLSVPFPITVPAAAGAVGPRLAGDNAANTTLSWMQTDDTGTALNFSRYQMGVWTAPATVAKDADMFVNWADMPAVTPFGQEQLLAHWFRHSDGGPHSYNIVASISSDAGETWSPTLSPHSDGTPTEHGFVSVYDRPGGVGLIWLDGRKMMHEVTDDPTDSGMTLRSATITSSGEVADAALVDELVCDCCQTDIAVASTGPIAVYRDRSVAEVRDISLARNLDGKWQTGVPIAADNWEIAGCPVNGPSVSADGDFVVVAWFTAANDLPLVKAAYSSNAGRSFSEPQLIGTESALGQVSVVTIDSKSFAVGWMQQDDDGSIIINVRTLTTDGQVSDVIKVGRTEVTMQVPQMTRIDDHLLVVWTDLYNDASKIVSVQVPIVNFYDL